MVKIKKQSNNQCPYEDEEQISVVQYLEKLKLLNHKIKYTAVPNSTYTPSWNAKKKNQSMGLRAGFPDLILIANNILFFIEMKRVKGGTVSAEQKEWIQALKDAAQHVFVCKGAEEAKLTIDSIIEMSKK